MRKLLRIDASVRVKGSHSRNLADFFEEAWRKANPNGEVLKRDLALVPIPHLRNETVEAFYVPEPDQNEQNKQAIELSDDLIEELKSVDDVLVSSPLYNLSIPSTLKAYLDHIIRSGHTFSVNEDGSYKGLLENTNAYVITTKGEVYTGTPMEALDFQEPYLKTIFGFINLNLKGVFALEGTAHQDLLKKNVMFQQKMILNELSKN
ncbi:FMN-dependent NADH-azoreductase [Thalassobellus sediminis]|uniref:FMN-dependent NADH-azoreductase n=1 Tax=Thalassobellus sediminis TaxID=3367753 RepID=UPI0037B9FEDF